MSAPATPLLTVDGLRVASVGGERPLPLLDGVSLTVAPGESVGIVGESGSGKSLAVRAVVGLLPPGTRVTGGDVRIGGTDALALGPAARHALRGRRVTLLMQDPFTMLHPQLTVGRQIADGLRTARPRGRAARAERRAEIVRRLTEVGLEPETADRYPHELSGGMRQRVAAAAALAGDPELLIADEPTTALDAANQRAVLDLLRGLQRGRGMGLVLITHDLRVAFSACDRVYVLYAGRVLEHGASAALESDPRHPYTAGLLASEPSVRERYAALPAVPGFVPAPGERGTGCPFADRCAHVAPECRTTDLTLRPLPGEDRSSACLRLPAIRGDLTAERVPEPTPEVAEETAPEEAPALDVRGADRVFRSAAGDHRALRDVSLSVPRGTVLALVGESGSGKTTLARIAMGLETFDRGEVTVGGLALPAGARPDVADRRALAERAQIVFQDPYASLNPLRTVGATLREALVAASGKQPRARADAAVEKLLAQVGLPAAYARRRPAALSGGERQRVAVARALAARPRLLICDEAVAALDVSVQAQLLNLLTRLQREEGFAVLFITHDLGVVRQIADRVAVMYRGEIVEQGSTARVLDAPAHPWTRRMLDGLPQSAGAGTASGAADA
ncbi:ABC transporter ATP-binding protein [Streptomyces longispororuber]|uniref:ABC transporter ATP-binding protein n=1 Tax=Streptomyces longispororuber TaxID=68230 RepID=UPI00210BC941|nr:ABC transporter ATP-binding protein [Streptomyces longispororuber]MCQ4214060.1 ABC transporter ATP-binding protein [Streptomyces longispororuber]